MQFIRGGLFFSLSGRRRGLFKIRFFVKGPPRFLGKKGEGKSHHLLETPLTPPFIKLKKLFKTIFVFFKFPITRFFFSPPIYLFTPIKIFFPFPF